MVDPMSTASLLGLASLFTTAIQCFEIYRSAQSQEESFATFIVQLEMERMLLLRWGTAIGLTSTNNRQNPFLQDPQVQQMVTMAFERIIHLFENTEVIRARYDASVKLTTLVPAQAAQQKSIGNLINAAPGPASSQKRTSFVTLSRQIEKYRWALFDEKKSQDLLEKLRQFVASLRDIVPAPSGHGRQRRRQAPTRPRAARITVRQIKQISGRVDALEFKIAAERMRRSRIRQLKASSE